MRNMVHASLEREKYKFSSIFESGHSNEIFPWLIGLKCEEEITLFCQSEVT